MEPLEEVRNGDASVQVAIRLQLRVVGEGGQEVPRSRPGDPRHLSSEQPEAGGKSRCHGGRGLVVQVLQCALAWAPIRCLRDRGGMALSPQFEPFLPLTAYESCLEEADCGLMVLTGGH